MRVGERIRFYRKERGLTQAELAALANVSVFTLRQYERGARLAPRIEQLTKLASALDISVENLLLDIDTEKVAARAEQLRAQEKAKKTIEDGNRIVCAVSVNVGIPDMYLKDSVEDADTDLLLTVHEICGMDNETITEDTVSGAIYQKWDPKKIKLVKDYLLDGQSQIKKIINAELANEQTPRKIIRAADGTPDSSK